MRMDTQTKQTQTEDMNKQTKKIPEHLTNSGNHSIQQLRRYADLLEGTNGHPPRDPSAFFGIRNITLDLQEIGEELNQIAEACYTIEHQTEDTEE